MHRLLIPFVAFSLLATATHGQPAAKAGASAAAPDSTALLKTIGLTPDVSGRVENECGERVAPSVQAAELGGALGTAWLIAIGGGPNSATCYGDGPDLHLLTREGTGYREIYAARGRMLIVLPTSTNGVRDLADGGPGFSFPVWAWNGKAYAPANRSVADSQIGDATFLP
jgi:hypothetical protein